MSKPFVYFCWGVVCLFCSLGFLVEASKVPLSDRVLWKDDLLGFIFFLVCGSVLLLLSMYFHKSVRGLPQRPVVRVWTHNGDTVITTNKVYLLDRELREELLKSCSISDPGAVLVCPSLYVYHSNGRCNNGISQDELRAILDSCQVQETEMGVPMGVGSCCDIGFRGMWKLIHGSNATLSTK